MIFLSKLGDGCRFQPLIFNGVYWLIVCRDLEKLNIFFGVGKDEMGPVVVKKQISIEGLFWCRMFACVFLNLLLSYFFGGSRNAIA